MNRDLRGIVIDPGHGGEDPGAVGNGIIEKDLNLMISKYIYDRLNELGLPVTLTRNDDTTLSPSERVNRILNAYGNSEDVLVLSNHINAGGGDGAEVIYALRNDDTLSKIILNNLEKAGQNPRKVFQRRLPSNTAKDYYFIHRNTGRTEPVIIEYGFLDSSGDDVTQLKNDSLKYAEAVVKSLTEYLGIPYDKGSSDYYIVKVGDSLYSIASQNNTTVAQLKELNDLTSNNLSIGQKLLLPGSIISEVTDYYIVKAGDSLYSIASQNNTTVAEIKSLNNLTSNNLSIGQKLIFPTLNKEPETSDYYIVKAGDNLYAIANQNNTTVNEIKKLNNLTSNTLSIGQQLILPSAPEIKTGNYYIVKAGDSLYAIANKNNTTVAEIKRLNNLTSNSLSIGQKLILPDESEVDLNNYYIVQSGDSLYSIAKRNNVSVDEIKRLNNLTSNLLNIGQRLIIPNQ